MRSRLFADNKMFRNLLAVLGLASAAAFSPAAVSRVAMSRVVQPAAHMFAFYFAILSAITPPVALAVFAAAGLAKADLWESGWAAMKVGAAGFIVPFMFVYEPALLLIGDPWVSARAFVTAFLGCICLAAGLHGYLLTRATSWQRVLLVLAALGLIDPTPATDAIGLVLLAIVVVVQWPHRAGAASSTTAG